MKPSARPPFNTCLIQEREAELLRAIADTLDWPIPPLVKIAESQIQTPQSIK